MRLRSLDPSLVPPIEASPQLIYSHYGPADGGVWRPAPNHRPSQSPPQTIGGSGADVAKLDPAQVDGPPGLGITRPHLDRLLSGMGDLDRSGLDFRELVPRPGG